MARKAKIKNWNTLTGSTRGGYCAVHPTVAYGSCSCANTQGSYAHSLGSYIGNDGRDGQQGSYGVNYQNNYSENFTPRSIPDVSYTSDLLVYRRHLYVEELKNRKLDGIGINSFGLQPSVMREDTEICDFVINKFKDKTMSTNFERRLNAALKRKQELDEKKYALLKRMGQKQKSARSKFENLVDQLGEKTPVDQSILEETMDDVTSVLGGIGKTVGNIGNKIQGNLNSLKNQLENDRHGENRRYVNSQDNIPTTKEKTDEDRVEYLLATQLDWYGVYQHHIEDEDGLPCIDFEFVPSIDEDDSRLDLLVELKGKVIDYEEKSANENIRVLEEDEQGLAKGIGKMFGKFAKKKTFIKRIRVKYDAILEKAKKEVK